MDGFEHIVDDSVWIDFGVAAQPAFIFINQDGNGERVIGAMGEQGITNALEDLISR